MFRRWLGIGVLCLLVLLRLGGGFAPALAAAATEEDWVSERAAGNNEFAVALYQKISADSTNAGKNIFFSPYSISTALAMTYAGACGETARQMAAALHFDAEQQTLHRSFRALAARLDGTGKPYQLKIANALWGQSDYPFKPEFLSLVNEYYAGGLQTLDFSRDPEPGRERINQWVAGQTADKIQNLLQPGDITSLTRLVLTNAIYFKGDWVKAFNQQDTGPAPFKLTSGSSVSVPMMTRTAYFAYAGTETLQAVELPYAGDDLAMTVIVPKQDLSEVERTLSRQGLAELLAKLQPTRLSLYLPRFKFDARYALQSREYLPALGMIDAFDGRAADFSGLTGHRDLSVSGVFHKAFVDVNESGTEAAAATGMVVGLTSLPAREIVVRADHPFLFLIQHKPTGTILFLGRVANPAQ